MLIPLIAAVIHRGGPKLTLSGELNATVDGASTYDATTSTFRFNTDGTLDEGSQINGAGISYVQVDAATDWIIPNSLASSDYQVRVVNIVGDAFTAEAAAENTWIDLGSAREWTLVHADVAGTDTVNFDFELRVGGAGGATASAAFELRVTNQA